MIDPLSNADFHTFREIVAGMTGDHVDDQSAMIDNIGQDIGGELAVSLARLDQRSLMKG